MRRTSIQGGAAASDTYVWVGPSDGSWSAPADWVDETTSSVGKTAPGAADSVVIRGEQSITGPGAARILTVDGVLSLYGDYHFGHVDDTDGLSIYKSVSANSIVADSLSIEGGVLDVRGSLAVSGTFSVDSSEAGPGDAQVGSLDLRGLAYVEVDFKSTLEIGHAGDAKAGVVTVDGGATLEGAGVVDNTIVDSGVIDAKGVLSLQAITGAGELRIEANSAAAVSSVAQSDSVVFAGPDAVLEVVAAAAANPGVLAGTITGFGVGDAMLFETLSITGLARATSGDRTILSLTDSAGAVVQRVTLEGSYGAVDFTLLPVSGPEPGVELLALPATQTGATSPPAGNGDHFVWTGAASVSWNDAANWRDVTHAGASGVPGADDWVSIAAPASGYALVTGSGAAARLTVTNEVVFDGSFEIGASTVRETGPAGGMMTLIGAGTTMDVAANHLGNDFVVVTDGALLRSTAATGGIFEALMGGQVVFTRDNTGASIILDASSRAEIGTLGDTALGALTVDAGFAGRNLFVGGNIVDDGSLVLSGVGGDGGSITGSGRIILDSGDLFADTIAGPLVQFKGENDLLHLSFAGAATLPATRVFGFSVGDTIELAQPTISETFLRYLPQSTNRGLLEIVDAQGSKLAAFELTGAYSQSSFLFTQSEELNADTILVLPTTIDHTVPPGTETGQTFQWQGPTDAAAAWSDPANWFDTTTNATATVAPGSLDTVAINIPYYLPGPFITGAASVKELDISSATTLDGNFVAATAELSGVLLAGAATSLQVGSLESASGLATAIDVNQALLVAGTADLGGTVALQYGGSLAAGAMSFADLDIDPTSRALVGNTADVGAARAGALTVESGATVDAGVLQGVLVDDGTVDVVATDITGAASGTGSFLMGESGSGARLTFGGSVAASLHIDLLGGDAVVAFAQAGDAHGSLDYFTVGDTIDFTSVADAAQVAYQAAGAAGGRLIVEDASGHGLASVHLLGDYRGASFALEQLGGSGVGVVLTAFQAHA